jgi:hypothetical protein
MAIHTSPFVLREPFGLIFIYAVLLERVLCICEPEMHSKLLQKLGVACISTRKFGRFSITYAMKSAKFWNRVVRGYTIEISVPTSLRRYISKWMMGK